MKKNYQTKNAAAAIAVPDTIAVAMTHLADELREGLLALAVGTGLQLMDAILEESVTALRPTGSPRPRADRRPSRTWSRLGRPRWTQGPGPSTEGAIDRRLGRGRDPRL
jgi:putative transposase